jgi:hypothetical protein
MDNFQRQGHNVLKFLEIEVQSPFDDQLEATDGPSETLIFDRVVPYRWFLSVCYGLPK